MSISRVADLGHFAVTCDSVATLLRRAVAVVNEQMGAESAIVRTPVHGSAVSVPILAVGEQPWGWLVVPAASLVPDEVDFLRAIAAIVGQAVARDMADESLQVSARQQSAIAELSRLSVNPISDLTLTRACDLIIERVGVEHSVFFALDRENDVLRYRAGNRWFPDSLATLPLTAASHGAECVARNEPVIVDDYASDTRFASARSLIDWGVRSGVIVPVTGSTGCVGILTAHSREPRTFSNDDIFFVEALANILAEAIERDGTRHELAASEDRYHDVVESASDIIFTIRADGTIVSLNRAFERITGYKAAQWVGRSVLELDPMNAQEVLGEMAARGGHGQYVREIELECPRGTVLLELTMNTKVTDDAPTAIHGFARDIGAARQAERDRRNLEAKLEQANRIAGLGKLAATVAHEFNNVLMGIAPFVDVMRRGKNIEASLEHISRAVARGRRITQDILRYTQPAEPSRVDLGLEGWLQTTVEEVQSLVSNTHRVRLQTCGDPLSVRADPGQLQQVFTNLILNARDAMPGGGEITIELRRETAEARLPFALDDLDQFAHLIVRDRGCGMNQEMLRHAFEPLFTTKRNGTGLGLPVALQVVQRHGGELFVESTPGAGTTFHIFLPLAQPEAAVGPRELSRQREAMRAKFVVLVEDDPIVATGLVGLLALEGLAVRLVSTGEEAIQILRRIRPDLVILDVGLPDIDGTTVFTTLGNALDGVPVIFSTGHADRSKIEHLLARPGTGFLLKPYEGAALLETAAAITRSLERQDQPVVTASVA